MSVRCKCKENDCAVCIYVQCFLLSTKLGKRSQVGVQAHGTMGDIEEGLRTDQKATTALCTPESPEYTTNLTTVITQFVFVRKCRANCMLH